MSFLAPLYLLTFLFSIPILLLWFLKQRRERVEVPTIFLWRRALEEQRVSPLIRTLTTSLLLLLQLLALGLLALAAAAAVLDIGLAGSSRRVILLVDRSASMATKEPGGHTRLDSAKENATRLLANLRSGDRAMLIAFDRSARILSGFTERTDSLARLVSGIQVRAADTDPEEALRVAAAQVASIPAGRVEIFLLSDGAFPPIKTLPRSLEGARMTYVGVGKTGRNTGIVSLSLDTSSTNATRAFVAIGNAGSSSVRRTASLTRAHEILDAKSLTIPARSKAGVVFDLSAYGPGSYGIKLEPGDALALDDRAYLVQRKEPTHRVLLITTGNPVLMRLRNFRPGVELYSVAPGDFGPDTGADVGRFDLTIFDGVVPKGAVPGRGHLGPSALYLDCVPPGNAVSLGAEISNPDIVDWDRGEPLNRNVPWSNVLIARARPVQAPKGATSLLETTGAPLVTLLTGPGVRVVAGFRVEETNLPLRLAFPIFFSNLFDQAFHATGSANGGYLPAGTALVRLLPPGVKSARVRDPTGHVTELSPRPDGTVAFGDTTWTGFYDFTAGGTTSPFAVDFLSEAETDIAPRRTLDIAGKPVVSRPEAVESSLPLRRPLLFAALAILLLEWALWLRGLGRRRRPAPAT